MEVPKTVLCYQQQTKWLACDNREGMQSKSSEEDESPADHEHGTINTVELKLEADLELITRGLRNLRLGRLAKNSTYFHVLPGEVLLLIAEHLAPEPVAIGLGEENTFLRIRPGSKGEWARFFSARQDLHNLSLVNKRMRKLTQPPRYRSLFLSKPSSLCHLVSHLAKAPSLGPLVRHINSAIELDTPANIKEMWETWKSISSSPVDYTACDYTVTSSIHVFGLLHSWMKALIPAGVQGAEESAHFPSVLFASLLAFTSRIEDLGIYLRRPMLTDPANSALWKWLMEHYHTPCRPWTHSGTSEPCWPPPLLRRIVVEYDRGNPGTGCSLHLDLIPRIDAERYMAAVKRCSAVMKNLAHMTQPSSAIVGDITLSDHVDILNYLDTLKEIPSIQHARQNLIAAIEDVKLASFRRSVTQNTKLVSDLGSRRELVRIFNLLQGQSSAPGRLCVQNKSVVSGYLEFLTRDTDSDGWGRLSTDVSILGSLELKNVMVTTLPSDLTQGNRVRYSLNDILLRDDTLFTNLKRLSLPLLIPKKTTLSTYGQGARVRELEVLSQLEELHITTEGLLGPTANLEKLFGGCGFFPVDETFDPQDFVEDQDLAQIIDGLPKSLKKLEIREWYHEYSNPEKLLPNMWVPWEGVRVNDCLARLQDLQSAILHNMARLAPFLKANSNVEKVELHLFQWNAEDAGSLMERLLRKHTCFKLEQAVKVEGKVKGPDGRIRVFRQWKRFIIMPCREHLVQVYKDHGIDLEIYFPLVLNKVVKALEEVKFNEDW